MGERSIDQSIDRSIYPSINRTPLLQTRPLSLYFFACDWNHATNEHCYRRNRETPPSQSVRIYVRTYVRAPSLLGPGVAEPVVVLLQPACDRHGGNRDIHTYTDRQTDIRSFIHSYASLPVDGAVESVDKHARKLVELGGEVVAVLRVGRRRHHNNHRQHTHTFIFIFLYIIHTRTHISLFTLPRRPPDTSAPPGTAAAPLSSSRTFAGCFPCSSRACQTSRSCAPCPRGRTWWCLGRREERRGEAERAKKKTYAHIHAREEKRRESSSAQSRSAQPDRIESNRIPIAPPTSLIHPSLTPCIMYQRSFADDVILGNLNHERVARNRWQVDVDVAQSGGDVPGVHVCRRGRLVQDEAM